MREQRERGRKEALQEEQDVGYLVGGGQREAHEGEEGQGDLGVTYSHCVASGGSGRRGRGEVGIRFIARLALKGTAG